MTGRQTTDRKIESFYALWYLHLLRRLENLKLIHSNTHIKLYFIFPLPYEKFYTSSSLSPMKNSKSKCNRKAPKIHLILIQSKIPFGCTKSVALRYSFQFSQKVIEWFLKKAHFTSPLLWKFLSPKPQKIHLILIQSKIPFGCTKLLALRYYFQIFIKSYRVVFEKSSLHFTSPMKISKSKCNRKPPQNPFNFDSIKNFFWLHGVNGI